jgi:outer membrane protein OmpA-like peptidoglycan-associated protein
MKLAERRAEAVKKELVNVYGIDASRISTEGKGASNFVAQGRNDVNRRVEFVVVD